MPKYSFECEACEYLRFERNLKMGTYETYPCPSCGEKAPLVISGFGFAFAAGKGAIANSGVHDQDYPTADKAVGRDADRNWAYIHAREKVKKAARVKGETPSLIRHTGPGYIDYEPMSDVGRAARKRMVKDAETVMKPPVKK